MIYVQIVPLVVLDRKPQTVYTSLVQGTSEVRIEVPHFWDEVGIFLHSYIAPTIATIS